MHANILRKEVHLGLETRNKKQGENSEFYIFKIDVSLPFQRQAKNDKKDMIVQQQKDMQYTEKSLWWKSRLPKFCHAITSFHLQVTLAG